MKVWAEPGADFCAAAIADKVASRLPVAGDQRLASREIGGGLSVAVNHGAMLADIEAGADESENPHLAA